MKGNIQTSELELQGIKALEYNLKAIKVIADLRDYSILQRSNLSFQFSENLHIRKEQAKASLSNLRTHLLSSKALTIELHNELTSLERLWNELSNSTAGVQGQPEIHFYHYDRIVQKLERLARLVSYESKLAYDPNKKNFFLIKLLIEDLPLLNRVIGKLRAFGSHALSSSSIDSYSYTLLEQVHDELIQTSSIVEQSLNYTSNLGISNVTINQFIDVTSETNSLIDYFYNKIILSEFGIVDISWQQFFDMNTLHLNEIYNISNNLLPIIKNELYAEIALQREELYLFLSLALMLYLVITYFIFGMYHSLKITIKEFSNKAKLLASGDLSVQVKHHTKDELSQVISAFNKMACELASARTLANDVNQRLINIMNTVPNGIVLLDKRGLIQEVNPEACRILGNSSELLLDNNIGEFIPVLQEITGELDLDNILKTSEESLLSPALKNTYIEYSGRLLSISNETHYLITITDINDRKLNQEKLLNLNEKLINSEKLASIGQLAAGIAHEINNPIGFVQSNICVLDEYSQLISEYCLLIKESGNLEAATKFFNDQDFDYILSDMNEIMNSSKNGLQRVTRIIKDLGHYTHKDDDDMEEMLIEDIILQSLDLVSNELKYKAEVIKEFAANSYVKCYPQKLLQVFINLFVNSSHAIENKGKIFIFSSNDKEFVKVSIKDTGTGIKPSDLKNLFDPFFTTKAVGKGTGLGLYIVHSIIKEHNGSILVESVFGEGCEIIIYIPKA
ncbi:ATP-binding protein [Pseudoalteromonas sp. NBT06-2]|uniref:sensor histidine kinase n=1 Tax=Pseudoalteromonas sp. NBT06-2 TaxID=2025950 RepID=UPI001482BBA6|nr:ATP-binding protein [Pseudoalteromonas sp. NBT06-2]